MTSFWFRNWRTPNLPLAGRITNFLSNWSKLTNDQDILQIMKGLKIPFLERPGQKQRPTVIKMSQEEKKSMDTEIYELLRKGGNNSCSRIKGSICQQRFSDTEIRRWFLNQYTSYSHFKMKSLKQLKYFLRQNNLIVKADLKDTYFSILLHPETQNM